MNSSSAAAAVDSAHALPSFPDWSQASQCLLLHLYDTSSPVQCLSITQLWQAAAVRSGGKLSHRERDGIVRDVFNHLQALTRRGSSQLHDLVAKQGLCEQCTAQAVAASQMPPRVGPATAGPTSCNPPPPQSRPSPPATLATSFAAVAAAAISSASIPQPSPPPPLFTGTPSAQSASAHSVSGSAGRAEEEQWPLQRQLNGYHADVGASMQIMHSSRAVAAAANTGSPTMRMGATRSSKRRRSATPIEGGRDGHADEHGQLQASSNSHSPLQQPNRDAVAPWSPLSNPFDRSSSPPSPAGPDPVIIHQLMEDSQSHHYPYLAPPTLGTHAAQQQHSLPTSPSSNLFAFSPFPSVQASPTAVSYTSFHECQLSGLDD